MVLQVRRWPALHLLWPGSRGRYQGARCAQAGALGSRVGVRVSDPAIVEQAALLLAAIAFTFIVALSLAVLGFTVLDAVTRRLRP